jgi:hypothetical protein
MGDFWLSESSRYFNIVGDVDAAIKKLVAEDYKVFGLSDKATMRLIEFEEHGLGYVHMDAKVLEVTYIPDTQIEGGNPLKRFVQDHLANPGFL